MPSAHTSISRGSRGVEAALFDLFAQDDAGSRIHVMDLVAYGAGHRLIDVVILHNIFRRKALNAVSGFWAAVRGRAACGINPDEGQAVDTLIAL
jgi:hypothetical protein